MSQRNGKIWELWIKITECARNIALFAKRCVTHVILLKEKTLAARFPRSCKRILLFEGASPPLRASVCCDA